MLAKVRVLAYGLHSYSSAFAWISLLNADCASQSDFSVCFPDRLAGVDLLNEVASLFTTISYYYCICLRHCLDLVPCRSWRNCVQKKLINFFWFYYSTNPCHPSLSKKQNVFLPAGRRGFCSFQFHVPGVRQHSNTASIHVPVPAFLSSFSLGLKLERWKWCVEEMGDDLCVPTGKGYWQLAE